MSRKGASPGAENGLTHVSWAEAEATGAIERADAVVNLAGAGIVDAAWTQERKAELVRSRVESTRELVRLLGCAKKKPKVFVSASAVGFYGACGDEELSEDAPPGRGFLADLSKAWEVEALAAARHGVRVVVLRIGIVLGRGGALAKMGLPFKFFVGGPIGSGRQWVSWIHITDLLRLVEWAAVTPGARGPINAVSVRPVRMNDLARGIGRALGRPSWIAAPAFALNLLLGERAQVLLDGQRVVPRGAQHAGFKFDFPDLQIALDDLLKEKK